MIAFYFLASVGAAALSLWLAYLFCVAVDTFLDWRRAPHVRSYGEGFDAARNRLISDSLWFSESPETQELLANLGRGLNVSEAREKWRKAIAEKLEADANATS